MRSIELWLTILGEHDGWNTVEDLLEIARRNEEAKATYMVRGNRSYVKLEVFPNSANHWQTLVRV